LQHFTVPFSVADAIQTSSVPEDAIDPSTIARSAAGRFCRIKSPAMAGSQECGAAEHGILLAAASVLAVMR
jgi:hypothetical protein